MYAYQYGAKTLKLASLEESFEYSFRTIVLSGIVMQVEITESSTSTCVVPCPTIIGMSNAYVYISSDDSSLLGKALTINNIGSCFLELY